MSSMRYVRVLILLLLAALSVAPGADAQSLVPGAAPLSPPPPPPPPPPRIEVPKLPQLDAPPRHDYMPPRRSSFSDRIIRCLDDAAAVGLGPNERAAYSRSCANR
jgi:hypothetical protein